MVSKWSAVFAMAGAVAFSQPGLAQTEAVSPPPATGLTLELNNAVDLDGGCRLTYVAFNGTTTALDETSFEAVVFDSNRRVSQFLILDFGRLPSQKTKVVLFDIGNSQCSGISRLLINNISKCSSGGETLSLCLDALTTTSRTPIVFGL